MATGNARAVMIDKIPLKKSLEYKELTNEKKNLHLYGQKFMAIENNTTERLA